MQIDQFSTFVIFRRTNIYLDIPNNSDTLIQRYTIIKLGSILRIIKYLVQIINWNQVRLWNQMLNSEN